jgi:hypothetical protein
MKASGQNQLALTNSLMLLRLNNFGFFQSLLLFPHEPPQTPNKFGAQKKSVINHWLKPVA